MCFNTQPPEGGCIKFFSLLNNNLVSTHSRPKAAAGVARRRKPLKLCFNTQCGICVKMREFTVVSTHSRPKAAAYTFEFSFSYTFVSTHSRPKAAAFVPLRSLYPSLCFNTQPPEGGCKHNRRRKTE